MLLSTSAILIPSVVADTPDVFKHTNNALGAADRRGNFSLREIISEAKLFAGVEGDLPLGIMFNSDQRCCANSCLGYGWWFPMLESTVSQVDENNVVMYGPGGMALYFARDPKASDVYLTRDFRYRGRQASEKDFTVEDGKGWALSFHEGRLFRLRAPDGDEFKWNYVANRVTSIVSKKNGELLRAQYDPQTGLLKSLETSSADGRGRKITLSYTQVPLIARMTGDLRAIQRLLPSLAEVKRKNGEGVKFDIEASNDLAEYRMFKVQTDADGTIQKDRYSWRADGRLLVSDTSSTYHVIQPDDRWEHAKIERIFPDGTQAGYAYNAKTGILEEAPRGGGRKTTSYILSPGPAFGKIRRRTQPSGEELGFEYDQTGRLLRRTIKGIQGATITSFGQDGSRIETSPQGVAKTTRPLPGGVALEFKEGGSSHQLVFKGGRLILKP